MNSPTAINIYQVFTRLFRNDVETNKHFGTIDENGCSKFEHFTPLALQAIREFGITHVWFTGVLRHATCTVYEGFDLPSNNPQIVKGRAGSPYAITDYYDVDPDLATQPKNRMAEFEALVERCHDEQLRVIIDFVPNHVAREYKSLCQPYDVELLGASDDSSRAFLPSNNFYYVPNQSFQVPNSINFPYTQGSKVYAEVPAKATGNDAFTAQPSITDWYETIKLNYGVDYLNGMQKHFDPIPSTWHKMLHIMKFWAKKGVDGLRCDMAEMVPVEFWKWAIPQVKMENKELIFVAEVYTPNNYEKFLAAGFDYLYDKVGLYDISRALIEGHGSAKGITQLWQNYEGYSNRMLRFLENHDEQRIASPHFAGDPWRAVPSMVLAATMSTGPLMTYFGQEIGEKASDSEGFSGDDGRTSIFDYWHVTEYQKWVNKGKFNDSRLSKNQIELRNFYKRLNHIRLGSAALNSGGFYDLMWVNSHLNQNKIFAYLRHHADEVLLIVLNFDLHTDCKIRLKIPSDAIVTAALSPSNPWKAKGLLLEDYKVNFQPQEAMNEGIPIFLKANGCVVFRLRE
jgi:glycosidase